MQTLEAIVPLKLLGLSRRGHTGIWDRTGGFP